MTDDLATQAQLGGPPSAKRRKVRKGTRSCWECKRRKVKCVFAQPDDAACVGCQRWRAPCVAQDMDFPADNDGHQLDDRIHRVEGLMRQLIAAGASLPADGATLTPESALTPNTPPTHFHTRSSLAAIELENDVEDEDAGDEADNVGSDHHVHRRLMRAFPCRHDAVILLRESGRPAVYTHFAHTQPHSKLTVDDLSAPFSAAQRQLPGATTHPVTLARLMLEFAITLQSPSGDKVVGLSEPPQALRDRLVATARRWVTTNGHFHDTMDALVCIMMEGAFETNAGRLRPAWAVFRRAMMVAQLMGLHRPFSSHTAQLRRIDPGLDVLPNFLWFRIVWADRYLSLLLGLPQGSVDISMSIAQALQSEPTPLGKFERRLAVVACRILQRNESVFVPDEMATTTQPIDGELLEISKSMPPGFWRPVNFHTLHPGSPETLLETMRLSAHVFYYGLLLQLHIPYMIHADSEGRPDDGYSKMTCVNAGREILSRFVAHRSFNPLSSCSRPVDFFALLAAIAILLAHIDANQRLRDAARTNMLAHQRVSDLAMLDQALERMDTVGRANDNDTMAESSAHIIRQLRTIEADAADGHAYSAKTTVAGAAEAGYGGSRGIRLEIPYLGVIELGRRQSDEKTVLLSSSNQESRMTFSAPPPPPPYDDQHSMSPTMSSPTVLDTGLTSGSGDWDYQGIDLAFFDTLMRGAFYPGAVSAGLDHG